ncbi:hypothetical protein [Nostoc sp. FACHB-888]|uniref:ISAzo13-like element transposase-related protein n=1 Tax=Nostoc sp. FACHB-888 TaxID=2692842 RepID=UPI0018EFDCBA|nr:hypothetical protein [Nostoc sp. FACHB-888]
MDTLATGGAAKSLTASQIEDLRLAASKMNGVERRSFQAQMTLKYCQGSARQAETVFGWGRQNIEVERCWGILEQHWNGTKLVDVETMLSWASSMTWKGLHPILTLSNIVYQKGISLTKKAMKQVESRLQRNPLLPKWDILIRPL